MTAGSAATPLPHDTTLVDLLDRMLDRGVVLTGDVVLSVAQVDLVHLGVQLVLRGIDGPGTGNGTRPAAVDGTGAVTAPPAAGASKAGAATGPRRARAGPASDLGSEVTRELGRIVAGGGSGDLDPDEVQRGLASLVLTLVEVLRELLERQALRRMDRGTVSDDEIERLGSTFLALSRRMDELKDAFGLRDEDLNLDLGPLGHLR